MTELMKAATEMFLALAALARYALEQERAKSGGTAPVEAPVEKPAPAARTRKAKETPAAAAPVDLIPAAETTATEKPAAAAQMTEQESAVAVQNAAKAIVQRFPNPQGDEKRPEGFHKAKQLLTEKFKVARITDLTRAQRLEFIREIEAVIRAADSAKTAVAA